MGSITIRRIKNYFLFSLIAITSIPIGLAAILLLGLYAGFIPSPFPSATNNVSLYSKIVENRLQWSSNYDFLPKQIPSNAKKVAFYHVPHFLQGADIIALRLSLPVEDIEKIIFSLSQLEGKRITNWGNINPSFCYPKFDRDTRGKQGIDEELEQLPASFQVYLVHCDLKTVEENWNHAYLGFIAISSDLHEVVYYVEWN